MMVLTPRMMIAAANAQVGLQGRAMHAIARIVGHRLNDGISEGQAGYRAVALDVAMIHHWGHASHLDVRSGWSSWPLAEGRTPDELAQFGAQHGVLRVDAAVGDIALLYGPQAHGFVRAGLVAHVRTRGKLKSNADYFEIVCIEGDSNERGELNGGRVTRVGRRVCAAAGDRFVRWADLGEQSIEHTLELIPRRRERIAL